MGIINFVYDIINFSWFWLVGPFLLGWIWVAKTAADDVLCSHINDLQTKKIDTDWKDYKARAFLSADQLNIANTTVTKVLLNAETYDPGSNFNADGANSEFVAPISAYYLVCAQVEWYASVADKLYRVHIYVNGAEASSGIVQAVIAGLLTVPITDILYVAAGETIDLRCYHNAGAATPDVKGHANGLMTYLDIHILSV